MKKQDTIFAILQDLANGCTGAARDQFQAGVDLMSQRARDYRRRVESQEPFADADERCAIERMEQDRVWAAWEEGCER
jgi:hypothetical protein